MKAWLAGILALITFTAGAATTRTPYYAYVAVKSQIDCSKAADPTQCKDSAVGIKDPVKEATVFTLSTSNPFALRLSSDGTQLVLGLSSNDGRNRVFFEVFDDTENNVTLQTFRVAQPNLACSDSRLFVVANVNAKPTVIVPCREGFTFYSIDTYYALGSPDDKRITLPQGATPFYYNLALEKSADDQWLFGVGNVGNKLGVSAVRIDDLAAGKLDTLISVELVDRIYDYMSDSAALAVRKTPPDALNNDRNAYDILIATNRSQNKTYNGNVYVVRQRPGSSLDGSKPRLETPSLIYAGANAPLNVVDPRGFAITPKGFTVHMIDYGREQEVDSKGKLLAATINGELISFAVTATGNDTVIRRKLALGIPGFADRDNDGKGIAAAHPVSIGMSPSGDRLYVYESEWAKDPSSSNGAYLRAYVVNTLTQALNEPPQFYYIDSNNAFASGVLIGPECASCLEAITASPIPPSPQRSSAMDGLTLAALALSLILFVKNRRAQRATSQ